MDPMTAAVLIFLSVQYVGIGIILYFIMRGYKDQLHDPSIPMITAIFWPILCAFGTFFTIQDLITGRKKIKW